MLHTVVILGNRVDVVESPNTKDPETRSLEMTQDKVHIGRVGEETAPVAVGAGVVLRHAVDAELCADGLGEAGAGRGRGRGRPGGRADGRGGCRTGRCREGARAGGRCRGGAW